MNERLGGIAVFATSAAVLIIEIAAVRLMAPYVGETLETFTAIISTVLAGIAIGTWVGGRLADVRDPVSLIGPELGLGGVLTMASVIVVRTVGPSVSTGGPVEIVGLTVVAIFAPAAVLSAVSPAVVKAVLADLGETGRVVGRMSALGTAGAIVGSAVTGFVLVATFTTTSILIGVGSSLAVAGAVVAVRRRTLGRGALVLIAALIVGPAAAAVGSPCEAETPYFCATVGTDPLNENGRILILDGLTHSYVDLADPTNLEFSYSQMIAAIIDAETSGPLSALHIGGAGFTMPRWLEVARPGSESTVFELDDQVIDIAVERLALDPGAFDIEVGDARLLVRAVSGSSFDLVIGDAFGGRAVPWHLTTVEMISDIADTLRPGGMYLINMIDGPELGLVKAEAATLGATFPHVVVVTYPERLTTGGNFILGGSEQPFDVEAIATSARAMFASDVVVLTDDDALAWAGGAVVLTDDYAPVDQLISD